MYDATTTLNLSNQKLFIHNIIKLLTNKNIIVNDYRQTNDTWVEYECNI